MGFPSLFSGLVWILGTLFIPEAYKIDTEAHRAVDHRSHDLLH